MGDDLFSYLKENLNSADVFLFQEVFKGGNSKQQGNLTNIQNPDPSLFEHLTELFTGYNGLFCPVFEEAYGIAMFIKKDIKIIKNGEVILFDNPDFPNNEDEDIDHTRKMQWVEIEKDGNKLLVMNVHGTWSTAGKSDSPERLVQSERIISFMDKSNLPKVLMGDFNLRPDTKSVSMLEDKLNNLIKSNNIETTRTSLYTKTEKFADYTFIGDDLKVKNFEVLMHKASDHAAMVLDLDF